MKLGKPILLTFLTIMGMMISACAPPETPDNVGSQSESVETKMTNIGDWESPNPQNLPETINVGVLFGLSGDIAVYGEVQQRGVQLAVQQINNSGYLGEDTKLEALYEDTGASGGRDVQAARSRGFANIVARAINIYETNVRVIQGSAHPRGSTLSVSL